MRISDWSSDVCSSDLREALMPVRRTRKDDGSQWTAADSRSIYGIRHWGAGYFAINDQGNVEVRPQGPSGEPIEFNGLIAQLREAGLSLPLLVRFPGILQDRVRDRKSTRLNSSP